MKTCDMVLVGVGGQGIVTLGDLLARAACAADVPIAFVPTKGMAQRGGFVKVEVRLGRAGGGARIQEGRADVIVGMERSEVLKGVRFLRPGAHAVLYDHVWEPTGVMLGVDAYPARDRVLAELSDRAGRVVVLDPERRPRLGGQPAAANIFTLGALSGCAPVREALDPRMIESVVVQRWPKATETNLAAFHAGLQMGREAPDHGFSQFARKAPS